jgi:protein-S-isoprenylcysteine O-methyltransferase Ste14
MSEADRDTPDLPRPIVRPPILYAGSIALGSTLQWLRAVPVFPTAVQVPVGVALVMAAGLLFTWSVREFCRADTPVASVRPTTRIVETGPYGFSRNPIYLAFTMLHLGVAVWVNSAWLLGTLAVCLGVMSFGVIAREERYLERRFGEAYTRYRATVRRWL